MNRKIQVLRGIAIIAVIMIHTCIQEVCGVIFRPFLNFAVALFIFLSGYLTNINRINKQILIKRLRKVLIPYMIWSVIYTIAYNDFDKFIKNFLTGNCCGIFYFIFVYIQFVLLTPIIIKLLKSKYKNLGYFITPITFIFFRYPLQIFNKNFSIQILCFTWFIYYYLGLIYGNNLNKFKSNKTNLYNVYIISIIFQIIEGIIWFKIGNYNMATSQIKLTSMFSSIVFCIICYEYLNNNKKCKDNMVAKSLLIIGNCSFGIYFSHILIIGIFNKIDSIGIMNLFPINSIIVLLISTICVIIGKKILKNRSNSLGL